MATVTVTETALDPAELTRRWDETIAPLFVPHSRLTDAGEEGWYIRFVVETKPGTTGLAELMRVRDRIASAFGVKAHQIHLGTRDNDLPSQFRLTVAMENPLQKVVLLDNPRGLDGAVPMGPYFDGLGEAMWRLHRGRRTYSGVAIGGPAVGKTELTRVLAVGARATLPTSLVYIDGGYGLSSPALAEHAERAGEAADAGRLLGEVECLVEERIRKLRERRALTLEVTDEDPLVLVVIDEAQAVFDWKTADRWEQLVALGDKTAVSVAVMVGTPGVESFGNSSGLRRRLMHGNSIGFHVGWPGELRHSLTRLDRVPNAPGVGVQVLCDGDPGRDFRVRWVGDHLSGLLERFPGVEAGLGKPAEPRVPALAPVPLG